MKETSSTIKREDSLKKTNEECYPLSHNDSLKKVKMKDTVDYQREDNLKKKMNDKYYPLSHDDSLKKVKMKHRLLPTRG